MLVFLLAIVDMLSMRSYGSYVQEEHSTDFPPKGSGIPKIIHLSSRVYWYKNMSMPNLDKSLRRSCIYLNPDWEVHKQMNPNYNYQYRLHHSHLNILGFPTLPVNQKKHFPTATGIEFLTKLLPLSKGHLFFAFPVEKIFQ